MIPRSSLFPPLPFFAGQGGTWSPFHPASHTHPVAKICSGKSFGDCLSILSRSMSIF